MLDWRAGIPPSPAPRTATVPGPIARLRRINQPNWERTRPRQSTVLNHRTRRGKRKRFRRVFGMVGCDERGETDAGGDSGRRGVARSATVASGLSALHARAGEWVGMAPTAGTTVPRAGRPAVGGGRPRPSETRPHDRGLSGGVRRGVSVFMAAWLAFGYSGEECRNRSFVGRRLWKRQWQGSASDWPRRRRPWHTYESQLRA
jgi:hypothetical protein